MNTHPNLLDSSNSVLLVVDVQQKLVDAMPAPASAGMIKHIGSLLVAARILEVPVLITEQYPQGLGETVNRLKEKHVPAHYFEKTGFSCYAAAGFSQALSKTRHKQIILTGIESHICVLQTAMELLHDNYQVYVVEDAVCSRNSEHKTYALQRMQQQGVTIINYESVLFEWLKGSHHPDFKTISALLR